ncbi:VTT domain-containing protein [Clostridium chromiireducens]|nr:VTT domain-containing protein [Clostridium chromiireducens]
MFFYSLPLSLSIDTFLTEFVRNYNNYTYLFLFTIVFCETGLFMAPFLPEESLLFVTGTLASKGALDIEKITFLLVISNIIGECVNYYIGKRFGTKIFKNNNSIIFNKKHIEKAQTFYDTYGGKTIIIAKFIPLVRTFIPFIAGTAGVQFSNFIIYNMIGSIPWVALFIIGGYFFGNIPIVANNFEIVIILIVLISISPAIITTLLKRRRTN